jgi:hypothetical protein
MFGKYVKLGKSIFYLICGNFLLARCGRVPREQTESLFVHPRPGLRRVIREEYIIEACRGVRVLHFGFLDNPITMDKISSGTLLHTRIVGVASSLYGVDVSAASLEDYRRLTGDMENTVQDLLQPDSDVSFLSGRFDVILFPEVLEHLANPGAALAKLKEIVCLNPGSSLLITVPNAFSLFHFVSACNNVEMVHADHYFYFSPTTLQKLLVDSGFAQIDIILYSHDQEALGAPGITEHGVIALCQL